MQNDEANPFSYFSIAKAAQMLSLSRSKIFQMVDSGELPSAQLGGRGKILIRRTDIEALLRPRSKAKASR
jgi:excisionase family DNA binding protein